MKRKILYIFFSLIVLFFLTGCVKTKIQNKKESSSATNFSLENINIVCSASDFGYDKIEQKIETTYNFNSELYATSYKVVTTQKFSDKTLYKIYKMAGENTLNTINFDNLSYDLETNDKTRTLTFTVVVSTLNINLENDLEKEKFKASEILKNIEGVQDATYGCVVNGIDRSKL